MSTVKGLILETYGAGNAPTGAWFVDRIKKAVQRGIIILDVTQCSRGSVEMGRYETSRQLLNAGVISGYDITTVKRRVPRQGAEGRPLRVQVRPVEPQLEGIEKDDRYVVVFSPYDMSCALEEYASLECDGYTRADAAKIGLNVLLYSLHP